MAQLQAFLAVLLGGCAIIAAVSGACAAVVKFWRYAHKDTADNTERLEMHDTYLASDKHRIERLERRQDKAEEMNRLQLKALVTLMSHELDGNHTSQLGDVRDEIQGYLIEKVGS